MSSRARGPRLSDEDRDLWARVTRDARRNEKAAEGALRDALARPAERRGGPPPAAVPGAAEPPATATSAAALGAGAAPNSAPPPVPRRSVRPQGAARPPVELREAGSPYDRLDPAAGLDRRTAERLRRGRLSPDARLDLHGMTADRAHAALIRFVLDCRARGKRKLLVITGKGGRRPAEDLPWMPERTGVLRHAVPQWLRLAPLTGLVVGVYSAHQTQGGEGALFVYLKKAR